MPVFENSENSAKFLITWLDCLKASNMESWEEYYALYGVDAKGQRPRIFFTCFRPFRCGFPAFGMAIGFYPGLFSSRRLCRSCLAKIAFNRLCQLVSERSVGHPPLSHLFFFPFLLPRDRAARRNLSWCPSFFSLFLSSLDFHEVRQFQIFRRLNNAKFKIYCSNNSLFDLWRFCPNSVWIYIKLHLFEI